MSTAAAGAFINEVADNPALLQRIDQAVAAAMEHAAMLAIAAIGRSAGYDFTVEELAAGPNGVPALCAPDRVRAA